MSRKIRINDALSSELLPDTLMVDDESYLHHVPKDAETHFKVIAISTRFENLNRIDRHRLVNSLVTDEFKTGLHALTLHLYTPNEWQQRSQNTTSSPVCHHGKP